MSKRSRFFVDLQAVTWNTIPWEKIEKYVFRLQTRIYKASLKNLFGKMKWLQKKLIACLQAKMLSVKKRMTLNKKKFFDFLFLYKQRRNQGDFQKQKLIFFYDQQKMIMIKYFYFPLINSFLLKNRKVIFKKSKILKTLPCHKKTKKSFFIMQNDSKIFLFRLALESEWESKFSATSFDFRPGRFFPDTIQLIFFRIKKKFPNNISIGKIKKLFFFFDFFSSKNQKKNESKMKNFFDKLHTFPTIQKNLKLFFNSYSAISSNSKNYNFIHNHQKSFQEFLFTIISQGLDFILISKFQIVFFIYAKNFISFFSKSFDFEKYQKILSDFLDYYGFRFYNVYFFKNCVHFNFLNHTFLRINFSKNLDGTKKIKNIVFPSKKSQKILLKSVSHVVKNLKGIILPNILFSLVSKLKNWIFFFRYSEFKKVFSKLDFCIYQLIRSWFIKRYWKSNFSNILLKYFPKKQTYFFEGKSYQDNLVFCSTSKKFQVKKNNFYIPKLTWMVKTKDRPFFSTRSPFDADFSYWMERFFEINKKLL